MVVVTRNRNLYRGTPRPITPVSAFSARRERAAERSIARRRLNFNNPYTRSITARRLMGYRTGPMKTVGYSPGTKTSFSAITVNKWATATGVINRRTLAAEAVTSLARQTTGNEINLRERDMINCKGFSLRFYISNNSPSVNYTIRMALVYDKNKTTWTDTDFFRGYGDSRTLDFDGSAAGGLDPCQLLVNPINRDKYAVLWERKINLGPDSDTTDNTDFSRTKDNSLAFNTFVPINRQLRYTGTGATSCADNIFLVAWIDVPAGVATDPSDAGFIYKRFVVMHWNDPK
jgi:hypothetical protein